MTMFKRLRVKTAIDAFDIEEKYSTPRSGDTDAAGSNSPKGM